MLKWTIGQQRRPDNTNGCCKPPFRKPKRRSSGKENTRVSIEERRSSDSPRTRDSVYMRLDAVPVALRDVSNYRHLDEPPSRTSELIKNGIKRACNLEAGQSPERKKQPCVERHVGLADQDCTGWMSASKFSLDSARSTLQIEFSPFPLLSGQSLTVSSDASPPSSLYYMNQSLSPIELDHKEIPLKPEEKAIILNTPLNAKKAATRREIVRRLCSPCSSELSPLASQFNFLHLSNICDDSVIHDLHMSPVDINKFSLSTLSEMDSCKLARNCVSLDDVSSRNVPLMVHGANTTRICSQTNNDRDDSNNNLGKSLASVKCINSVDNLVNPASNPQNDLSDRQCSSSAMVVDLNEPCLFKRRSVIRRRRNWDGTLDGPKAKISRSCLTLPDGIPSPFESPAVMGKLRRPTISLLTLPRGIPSPPSPILEPPRPPQQEALALPLQDSPESRIPDSLHTWDSHNLHFFKTPRLASAHSLNDATLTVISGTVSPLSSKLDESDEEGISSFGSSTFTERSPVAVVEGQSRSRRCLTFTSPRMKRQHRKSFPSVTRGELKLSLCYNAGFLTIHVIRGKNLQPPSGIGTCNAYIKVSLMPAANDKTFHRTCVRKNSSHPRYDTQFVLKVTEDDLDKRVLVSAWHRDRRNRKSEFLGCMSFGVRNAVKRRINGSFRLLSQGSGWLKNVPTMTNSENLWYQQTEVMANQSESSVEELVSVDESDACQSIDIGREKRRKSVKKEIERVHEDQIFLRHLELDPEGELETASPKPGRTPFTTTRTLCKQPGGSFGFSIAWTHPPRVERVESGLPADQAGLRPGDYVIFVGKINVVTLQEDEILQQIKLGENCVVLEVYRKAGGGPSKSVSLSHQPRSSTACSGATTTATVTASLELTKRRLHLPQVTFNSESNAPPNEEECRKRSIYQLLGKEQNYALCMQFGIARFMLPLAERKDLISPVEHQTLFQNAQELLRHTEDILELYVQEETLGQSIGRIYQKKMNALNNSYRKFCIGLKKSDCLLVEKTRNAAFIKLTSEPPIPKRRPDLTTFIHKPLEHYREVLKLLQTTLSNTKVRDDDYKALAKVVQEMQATYREITVESGLMEPDGEGRPLLSLQDLESRLVFTRCKPFVLSIPGRQWIFGGDLSRVEGRSVRPFWALLFTDLLLFAKVSRDRVIFITEEPLSLSMVSQALFSIRKKTTEFRLLISTGTPGEESPAVGGCAELTRTPRKGPRKRTVALRAPTPELKAVWQNLIQRQIIFVNTARGGTPASSPMDSPDPLTADSIESVSLIKRQVADENKNATAVDLIDHRCRQLGKSGVSKGSALHLAQWMRGQLGEGSPEMESEPEIWSPNTMRRRVAKLRTKSGAVPYRSISRVEEIELSDPETTSDSQKTIKSTDGIDGHSDKLMAMCRKCHKTCLLNNKNANKNEMDINANQACRKDDQGFSDESNWGPQSTSATISPSDPFLPVPHISVQPPTPTMAGEAQTTSPSGNNNFYWDSPKKQTVKVNPIMRQFSDEGPESDGEIEDPPYRSLSPCGLRRYGTVSSLEKLDEDDDDSEEDTSREQEDLPQDIIKESMGQSLRGWTVRAGTYVVEKMAFFEKMSEEGAKGGASFIDRYLRSNAEGKHSEELAATSTTLAGEDECETSGATSGEEVWGTPTSGDSGLTSPNNEFSETSSIGTALDDAREQLMFDRLLSGMSIMGSLVPLCPVTRGFPQRRRLDPLMEDVEEDSSDSTSIDNSDATKSYSTDQGNKSDSCAPRAPSRSATSTPHRFFNRLKLRRSQSADSKTSKPNKFMEFLRGSKSEEHTSSSGNRLTRLFSRENSDDIPTTLPQDFIQKREHDKTLDRRFWKQLRKRRSSNDATAKGSSSGT